MPIASWYVSHTVKFIDKQGTLQFPASAFRSNHVAVLQVAAGNAPDISSFEGAVRSVLQCVLAVHPRPYVSCYTCTMPGTNRHDTCRTDTVLEALEEYLDCSIPGASKGARNLDERRRNLGAVVCSVSVAIATLHLQPNDECTILVHSCAAFVPGR